jgi:predicted transposase YdaD
LAAVPRLLQKGLTLEAIAEALELSLEEVNKAAQQQN